MIHRRFVGAFGLLALCAAGVQAADEGQVRISGFGSLVATHASTNRADFAPASMSNGPGHTRDWDLNRDSRLGVQLDARLSERLSAVVQAITYKRYDDSMRPEVSLAHVKFAPDNAWTFRLGRMAMPFYLVSDFRRVGYATPWLRPPQEFYGLDFTSYDGAEATWSEPVGDWILTASGYMGNGESKLADGSVGKAHHMRGGYVSAEWGDHLWRASYVAAEMTVDSPADALFDAYRQFGAGQVARQYKPRDAYTSFTSIGYQWTPGDWLVMAEYGVVSNENTIFTAFTSAYVTVGYSFGNVRPYLTLARRKARLADPVDSGIAPLDSALNGALAASDNSQSTTSLGVRWDFHANAALKVQYDHVDLAGDSRGGLQNVQAGFRPGSNYDVLAVGVDFVF